MVNRSGTQQKGLQLHELVDPLTIASISEFFVGHRDVSVATKNQVAAQSASDIKIEWKNEWEDAARKDWRVG
jgi:hypothetical protein